MCACPKVKLEGAECFERDVKLRLPFRFGAATVTTSRQSVVRVTIALEDGRTGAGIAAETLAAKWFDKNPAFSDEQNLEQLRQALLLAIQGYCQQSWSTPFGLYAGCYQDQLARGGELGLPPLVASFGPALLDRAILDALGRITGQSFAQMIGLNAAGIEVLGQLTPDLSGFDMPAFLAGLRPLRHIAVRHTVGLLDPITGVDQKPGERLDDGLPETLEEVVRRYGTHYYKLKVAGNVAADLERLTSIAAVLDRDAGNYRVTLDGNEQFDDVQGIAELWRRIKETPTLARLAAATLFIEQPIKRASALAASVAELAQLVALIIDESDGDLSAFPVAQSLGYSGISSKSCKGLYKSILNAARVAKGNTEAGAPKYFLSAEDLTALAGTSVQQDLALVSLLGLTHVERNGHHFVDGMSFAPDREQSAFARAHSDLYSRSQGPARLIIDDGRLRLHSLACAGFAVAADVDLAALLPMPAALDERIVPAHPEKVQ